MKKVIASPGLYVQGEGEINNLSNYVKSLGAKVAYIIIDKFINQTYGENIIKGFNESNSAYKVNLFGGECSDVEINSHKNNLFNCDVIVGIGGGKCLDTAKAVGYYCAKPVIIVPTVASSDAPCSRLAVVYTPEGEFDHYLPLNSNPNIVVMDTEVISKAPVRLFISGIGDALATYFEAEACYMSNAKTMAGGYGTQAAGELAKLCFNTLIKESQKAVQAVSLGLYTTAVENIIEANTYLSGIGFESSGLAAAHAIHNGLTVLKDCHHMLHGEKVAFGVLSQLVLENRPIEEIEKIIEFCSALGLPTTFEELGLKNVNDEQLLQVAVASCTEGETIHNMPFKVSVYDVFSAMKLANNLAHNFKNI